MTTHMKIIPQDSFTDDALLAHEARSSAEAFAELYRRHVTRVYRYHLVHTSNIKDAEDLTSQTFMAALEGIRSFRGSGSFAAWVMGIAARKRAQFFRKQAYDVPLEEALHISTQEITTDRAANQSLQLAQINHALKNISQDRAEALILYFFSGLSTAEAGRVLGKSDAAVRMLISRGLNDLRTRTSLAMEVDYE